MSRRWLETKSTGQSFVSPSDTEDDIKYLNINIIIWSHKWYKLDTNIFNEVLTPSFLIIPVVVLISYGKRK